MSELSERHCVPCEGGTDPLSEEEARERIAGVPEWSLVEGGGEIRRRFEFKNFHRTMEFVNALAWIAHREDHHPDLEVGYRHCLVRYTTHAVGGLSDNDFICAAKIDALLK